MNKEIKEKAQELFKAYPKQEEFYVTADGEFFTDKNAAHSHKHYLTDKEVKTITRKEATEKEAVTATETLTATVATSKNEKEGK